MDVFKLWKPSTYTFLLIENNAHGTEVTQRFVTTGIVKLRDDMQQEENMEYSQSDSTIYVRPTEEFLELVGGNMIGHGILVDKDNYDARTFRIISQSKGDDQRGRLAFYRIKLRPEEIIDGTSS